MCILRIMFWTQLRYLLWKNFIIRRRQKVWLCIEFLWPLVLFAILAWVRTRGLTEGNSLCYYDAKAMPSAGLLPFLQSYLCTLPNTCHNSSIQDSSVGPIGNASQSFLWKLMDQIEAVMNGSSDTEKLEKVAQLAVQAARLGARLPSASSSDSIAVSSLFTNQSEFEAVMNNCGASPNSSRILYKSRLTPAFFIFLLDEIVSEETLMDLGLALQESGELDPFLLAMLLDPFTVWSSLFCEPRKVRLSLIPPHGASAESLGKDLCKSVSSSCAFSFLLPMLSPHMGQLTEFVVGNVTGRKMTWGTALEGYLLVSQLSSALQDPDVRVFGNVLAELFQKASQLGNTSDVLSSVTCGKIKTGFEDVFNQGGRFEEMREKAKEMRRKSQRLVAEEEQSSSHGNQSEFVCGNYAPFKTDNSCVSFLHEFGVPMNALTQQIHAVLAGFILLTPSTPVVSEIQNELQKWLSNMKPVADRLLELLENSEFYQNQTSESVLAQGVETFESMLETANRTLDELGLRLPISDNNSIVQMIGQFRPFLVPASDPDARLPQIADRLSILRQLISVRVSSVSV